MTDHPANDQSHASSVTQRHNALSSEQIYALRACSLAHSPAMPGNAVIEAVG